MERAVPTPPIGRRPFELEVVNDSCELSVQLIAFVDQHLGAGIAPKLLNACRNMWQAQMVPRHGSDKYDARVDRRLLISIVGAFSACGSEPARQPDSDDADAAQMSLEDAAMMGHADGSVLCVDAGLDAWADEGRWLTIVGGTFAMGSPDGDSNERPVHTVSVPSFLMMRAEVTVMEYRACVLSGSCTSPQANDIYCGEGSINSDLPDRDAHPVNCVTWTDANNFCSSIGARLPTEAEWEFAARGAGTGRSYAWGNAAPSCSVAVYREQAAGCGHGSTWPVCSKPAGNTPEGLCDMSGNVWEWVEDHFYPYQGYAGAPSDGSAWADRPSEFRPVRGASWGDQPYFLRATARIGLGLAHADQWSGFRCARDL
jgi:formylglycine-generating enzyme required for sulfatase activity